MGEAERQLSWRQGHVLTDDAAKAHGLAPADIDAGACMIVVSHDCDLAAWADKEPIAEIMLGRRISKLGADSFGKTARRLHIEYVSGGTAVFLELSATSKQQISKAELFERLPRQDLSLDVRGLRILQRWLAARYSRAAFPEAFENRLRAASSGKHRFLKRIEQILEVGAEHIVALLFDLDDGVEKERNGPDDCYQLRITVLYDGQGNEPAAFDVASKVAEELEELFAAAFSSAEGEWQNIELMSCDAVSSRGLSVAELESLKQWRLEHMSLQDDPPQPMLPP